MLHGLILLEFHSAVSMLTFLGPKKGRFIFPFSEDRNWVGICFRGFFSSIHIVRNLTKVKRETYQFIEGRFLILNQYDSQATMMIKKPHKHLCFRERNASCLKTWKKKELPWLIKVIPCNLVLGQKEK